MSIAADYAKALYELMDKSDLSKKYMANLRKALDDRGHQKLLPSIVSEYEKLELAKERSRSRSVVSPESERQRALLELYRRLISTE